MNKIFAATILSFMAGTAAYGQTPAAPEHPPVVSRSPGAVGRFTPPRAGGTTRTVLTFAQAVDMAVGASPKRVEAQADVDADAARRRQALSEMGPKVKMDYSDVAFDKAVAVDFGATPFTIRPDKMREGSISIRQPITGIYTAFEKAGLARATQNASEVGLELAKSEAAFNAAEFYRRAQQADEVVRIAQASIGVTEAQTRDAQSLADSGKLIRSDVLKINIAQQDARAALAKAIAAQRKAYERLRHALGLTAGQQIALEPLLQTTTVQRYSAPALDTAIRQASGARLEIKQASLQVERASYANRVANWRYAPTVDAFIKWDRIYSAPSFGQPDYTRSIGIAASWDIWDNGSRVFAHQEIAALSQKAETALQESKDKVRLELAGLFADLDASKEALIAAQATVTQAEEAYRLDKARFGSGLVTTTDLITSEAVQTKARGALVAAVTDIDLIILGIERALGDAKPH